jgi:hypothetical protein
MKEGNKGEENIKERKAQTCPSPAIERFHWREGTEKCLEHAITMRSVSKDLSSKSNNSLEHGETSRSPRIWCAM